MFRFIKFIVVLIAIFQGTSECLNAED